MTYDAVVFDLLTALLDSWTLWNDVAGSPDDERMKRLARLVDERVHDRGGSRSREARPQASPGARTSVGSWGRAALAPGARERDPGSG